MLLEFRYSSSRCDGLQSRAKARENTPSSVIPQPANLPKESFHHLRYCRPSFQAIFFNYSNHKIWELWFVGPQHSVLWVLGQMHSKRFKTSGRLNITWHFWCSVTRLILRARHWQGAPENIVIIIVIINVCRAQNYHIIISYYNHIETVFPPITFHMYGKPIYWIV